MPEERPTRMPPLTGTAVSPSIDHTIYLCGKDDAVARLDKALEVIASRGASLPKA